MPLFSSSQPYRKLTDHCQFHLEYQDKNGRIAGLATAVTGSNLDGLPYTVISDYATVRKYRMRCQNAENIMRKSFSLGQLENMQ